MMDKAFSDELSCMQTGLVLKAINVIIGQLWITGELLTDQFRVKFLILLLS